VSSFSGHADRYCPRKGDWWQGEFFRGSLLSRNDCIIDRLWAWCTFLYTYCFHMLQPLFFWWKQEKNSAYLSCEIQYLLKGVSFLCSPCSHVYYDN
jgi:hypothetical protein